LNPAADIGRIHVSASNRGLTVTFFLSFCCSFPKRRAPPIIEVRPVIPEVLWPIFRGDHLSLLCLQFPPIPFPVFVRFFLIQPQVAGSCVFFFVAPPMRPDALDPPHPAHPFTREGRIILSRYVTLFSPVSCQAYGPCSQDRGEGRWSEGPLAVRRRTQKPIRLLATLSLYADFEFGPMCSRHCADPHPRAVTAWDATTRFPHRYLSKEVVLGHVSCYSGSLSSALRMALQFGPSTELDAHKIPLTRTSGCAFSGTPPFEMLALNSRFRTKRTGS